MSNVMKMTVADSQDAYPGLRIETNADRLVEFWSFLEETQPELFPQLRSQNPGLLLSVYHTAFYEWRMAKTLAEMGAHGFENYFRLMDEAWAYKEPTTSVPDNRAARRVARKRGGKR